MPAYTLSPDAQLDLQEIYQYIAHDNVSAARRMREKFNTAFESLAHTPHMGHLREEVTDAPVKFWNVGKYSIVYDPDSTPLAILRVLHGYRDLAQVLS